MKYGKLAEYKSKACEGEEQEGTEGGLEGLSLLTSSQVWAPGVPAFHGAESRSVLICGEIDETVANTVSSQLMELNAESSEEPAFVYINTVGGDVNQGLALYDWMRCLPMPIIGVAYGRCASAGLFILMGADIRASTPNCRFFYHEVVQGAMVNSREESQQTNESYIYYQDKMMSILRERAKINKRTWTKHFEGKTNFSFTPEEAKEFGFVHKIMTHAKKKKMKLVEDDGE